MDKIDFLTQIQVETGGYEMSVDSWVVLEKIASQLEMTKDYLLDEFAIDGKIDLEGLCDVNVNYD